MSDERPGTRGQEHVIEIDASPADVWRAISEAEEVIRWYVADAQIDDHVGGTYKVSWGEGMDGASDITAYEPERHLQVRHRPVEGAPLIETGPMIEEYFIEGDGDRTVLRLVTSGIPDTEEWDWYYEGTKRGWTVFMLTLRHYLENHDRLPRDHIVSMAGLPGSSEDAWPSLMGPSGLGISEALDGAGPGSGYSGTTAFGDELVGQVLLLDPPHRLVATVDGLSNALLACTLEQMGESEFLYMSLSTFGLEPGRLAETRTRWETWISGLFPSASPPAEVGAPEGADV